MWSDTFGRDARTSLAACGGFGFVGIAATHAPWMIVMTFASNTMGIAPVAIGV